MKQTSREMTLRGTFEQQVNRQFVPHNIFEYSNVLDLSKAWKIKGYAVWPQGWRQDFGAQSTTQSASIETFLATDSNIFDNPPVMIQNSPEDNRQIAWGNTIVNLGSGDKSMSLKNQGVSQEHYWIDPNHVIQDLLNLYIRIGCSSDYEGLVKRFNYIVWMEEVEITDTESIIFNIKGKSQDLSS